MRLDGPYEIDVKECIVWKENLINQIKGTSNICFALIFQTDIITLVRIKDSFSILQTNDLF